MNILQHITDELPCKVSQVEAAVTLLDEGVTVAVYLPLSQGGDRGIGRYTDVRHLMMARPPMGMRMLLV